MSPPDPGEGVPQDRSSWEEDGEEGATPLWGRDGEEGNPFEGTPGATEGAIRGGACSCCRGGEGGEQLSDNGRELLEFTELKGPEGTDPPGGTLDATGRPSEERTGGGGGGKGVVPRWAGSLLEPPLPSSPLPFSHHWMTHSR